MKPLSTEDLERSKATFAEAGYVVFEDVVPKDRLRTLAADLAETYDRMKRSGELFQGGGGITGHLNCYPGAQSRFIYDAIRESRIEELVNQIFPRLVTAPKLNVGCNMNLPNSVAQHYHIDGSFLGDFMVVNTAVVDTDIANGAIDVLPRTHKKFYKYWQFAVERPYRNSTRIPMKAGDVLIRTSRLWHRGMPNTTNNPRPMVAMTFGDPGTPTFPEPFATGDGKIAFYENWYSTGFLGRVRERTFVAAPITYSAYRFVRSLVGNKGYATQ